MGLAGRPINKLDQAGNHSPSSAPQQPHQPSANLAQALHHLKAESPSPEADAEDASPQLPPEHVDEVPFQADKREPQSELSADSGEGNADESCWSESAGDAADDSAEPPAGPPAEPPLLRLCPLDQAELVRPRPAASDVLGYADDYLLPLGLLDDPELRNDDERTMAGIHSQPWDELIRGKPLLLFAGWPPLNEATWNLALRVLEDDNRPRTWKWELRQLWKAVATVDPRPGSLDASQKKKFKRLFTEIETKRLAENRQKAREDVAAGRPVSVHFAVWDRLDLQAKRNTVTFARLIADQLWADEVGDRRTKQEEARAAREAAKAASEAAPVTEHSDDEAPGPSKKRRR